jgi:hypothetical protein
MTTEQDKTDEVVCLVCGDRYPAKSMTRGLCPADYQKFIRAKQKATKDELPKLEAILISQGKLLPDARDADNPFAAALAKVRESAQEYTAKSIADEVLKNDSVRSTSVSKNQKKKGTR